MAVTARGSDNAFAPFRGTDQQIQAFPVKKGAVYFAYDTNKIYFDDGDGNRHVMSGSGIKFVYGHCVDTLVPTNTSNGYLPYPRSDIDLAYYELNKPTETYQIEDIIINHDYTFYRIKAMDEEYCYCEKMLVAGTGSGGGSGEEPSGITLVVTNDYPQLVMKGTTVTSTVRIVDTKTKTGNNGIIYAQFYASESAETTFRDPVVKSNCPINQGETTIEIPYNYLRTGLNVIRMYARVNNRVSEEVWQYIQVVDIELVANENTWKPTEFKSSTNVQNFVFPYRIIYDTTMKREDFYALIDTSNVVATAIIDMQGKAAQTKLNITSSNAENGQIPLAPLFAEASHGNHTLDIIATMTINGTEITITRNLHYEIGWFVPTGQELQGVFNPTVIWSPFPHEATFENYTLIEIPFMVMNPAKTDSATVTYYINDEEISSLDVEYNSEQYEIWEVSNYKLGTNVFTITSGQAQWSTTVEITKNMNYTLEPTAGAVLDLTATGRTNNESKTKRAQWPNQSAIESNYILKTYDSSTNTYNPANIELNNFNWYNNGWLKDDDGNTCLRVSNGASVFIPISKFSAGGNQTYEFEFAIHNATDYSRLTTTETVYLTYDQLFEKNANGQPKYQWYNEETRSAEDYDTDLYEADGEGYAIEIATGERVPQVNPKTGDEVLRKVTATSGRGTFMQYYASNKGIILGTQEAFLALSQSLLVNARYTDDARVKVSFVISQNPQFKARDGEWKQLGKPMIFAYINGVITNILPFTSTTTQQTFSSNTDPNMRREGMYIYSDYCDIDIYKIRVYETDLTFSDVTQNWTSDGSTLREKKNRYDVNQGILDSNKTYIDYLNTKALGEKTNLPSNSKIPVMVIQTAEYSGISKVQDKLPYYKGNKIGANLRYYDPNDPQRCWHASNVQLNVQGTSSQGYPRRNFKFSLKAGAPDWFDESKMANYGGINPFRIAPWDGEEANKDVYNMDFSNPYIKYTAGKTHAKDKGTLDIGIGIKGKSFCLKADYMDSSSSHNTPGANLVKYLSNLYSDDGYDLRHPLKRLLQVKEDFRTTVYGFPILVFWEHMDGDIEFVGRYNFNYDKSSENVFGFTYGEKPNPDYNDQEPVSETNPKTIPALHPYVSQIVTSKVNTDENDPNYKQNLKTAEEITIDNPTYEQVTECWELTNNQPGWSKFQDDGVADNWLETATTTANNQVVTYYGIEKHFEQRYPEMDGTNFEGKSNKGNEVEWRYRPQNLKKLWDWIRTTDVTSYIGRKSSQPVRTIEPIYYKTLSSQYEQGIHYYEYRDNQYVPKTITVKNAVHKTGAYNTTSLTLDDNGVIQNNNYYNSTQLTFEIVDESMFWTFVKSLETDNQVHPDSEYVGEHTLTYENLGTEENPEWVWRYGMRTVDLSELGINFSDPNQVGGGIVYLTFNLSIDIDGFNTSLYELFTVDNDRYRLAKFKNEFTEHLNFAYTLFYFVYTEFFLLYDSRQKNMMIASWGPEKEGGEYIWYPIFYDLDTQLGINNSGQVYWDYDIDATPPLTTRTVIDPETDIANVEIYSSSGSTDSIFSGNGSVLWNNVQLCFPSDIASMFKAIRAELTQDRTTEYYETNSSDRWSESMKNYDAFYKYIAPAIDGLGYIDEDGAVQNTTDYYYCLQGDRSLQRISLIRNRFNYLDSMYGAASYDPTTGKRQIKMRYNLNDRDRTSDQNTIETAEFDSNAVFTIKPYLSQYLSIVFDQTSSDTVKFNLGGQLDNVVINPPVSIAKRASLGVALTQQLAYIRGPQYLSSIGDLAPKYCNELVISSATRLRDFKVGDEREGYRNENLTSLIVGAKGLLKSVDLSNLSELRGDPEIDQCPKLEVLKLLGTNIASLPLPKGNVLTTVYLPKTISEISLVTPLKLTTILTDRATQASYGHNSEGLFIEGLTDMLDYLNESEIPSAINSNIELYQMDDTKLGYGTYLMLAYLYKLKRERFISSNKHTTTSPNLKIQVLNANWTPYQQVAADEAYDSNQANNYYERRYLKYYRYTYESASKWQKDISNGIVYLYDTNMGVSPIRDLNMFRQFIDDKNAMGTIDNYQFQPLKGDVQNIHRRIIPTITGHIHLSNTSATPINEAEIFSYYQAEGNFTDLDITADYVTEAARALFIEYTPEGVTKELYCQKYYEGVGNTVPQVSYGGDVPQRLHYDFLGWVEKRTNDTYDWEANGSIRNDWSTSDNECVDLSNYNLSNGSYTFIAVYSITGYTISYFMDDGSPVHVWSEIDGRELDAQVTSVAVAGSPAVFTSVIPWKNDDSLALKRTYRFKGWKLSMDPEDTKLYNNTTTRLIIDRNTSVYASFDEESVYDTPLTTEEMIIRQTAADQVFVTVPVGRGLRGKVCFPSSIQWSPSGGTPSTFKVVGLLGAGIEDDSASLRPVTNANWDGGNLSYLKKLTGVFFKGCDSNATEPDYITEFPAFAFMGDDSLRYVDIPASLKVINRNAFRGAPLCSAMNDLKNVYQFGIVTFYQAFSGATDDDEFTLFISSKMISGDTDNTAGMISDNAFNSAYIKNVVIGSNASPINRVATTLSANSVFNAGIQSILLYVTENVDQDSLRAQMLRYCESGASPDITCIPV